MCTTFIQNLYNICGAIQIVFDTLQRLCRSSTMAIHTASQSIQYNLQSEICNQEDAMQKPHRSSTKPISTTLDDGPIVFLTPGSAESLAALPGLATFAATLGRRLTILHVLGRSDSHNHIALALAALGADGLTPDLQTLAPGDVIGALTHIATTTGGILALLPRRPRPLDRLLVGSEYE